MKRRAELGESALARFLSSLGSERDNASYRSSLTSSDATQTWTSSVISSSDANNVNLRPPVHDHQSSDTRSEIETLRSGRSRVHDQSSVDPGNHLPMGVAVHDDVSIVALRKLRGRWASHF